jgi:hypothetical protein
MKLAVAAIYTSFRTTIVNDDNIEAIDAYTVKPTGDKLILKFESVWDVTGRILQAAIPTTSSTNSELNGFDQSESIDITD